MRAAAADLEFEEAARLRDELRRLEAAELMPANGNQPAPRLAGSTFASAVPAKGGRGKGGRGRRRA
jgi:excinuclease ABC subunit B